MCYNSGRIRELPTDEPRRSNKLVSRLRSFLLVAASVAFSTAVRFALNPLLGRRVAFIVYFPALVFSAWVGGWPGGLLALGLSTLAATYYFITPSHALWITSRTDQISLIVFLIVGLSVSALSSAGRRAQQQAEQAAEDARRSEHLLQLRAEREAAVNRIGQAIRASLDPDVIQATVAALLGETLGADRCYYATYDWERDALWAGQDWHHPDLPPLAGRYKVSDFAWVMGELFAHGTAVFADVRAGALTARAAEVQEKFGHRAVLAVPFFNGEELVAAVFTAMREPRAWTPDEVALVEQVATLTRTALETARVTRREHTIAQQLQAALQPPLPGGVPGLELADYYRPALEEAGVGGDFSDVFPADKGVTFLVVGDLSGKGLAAASQVATVRNMLRFALFNGRSVAGPVNRLNRTLTTNDLLTGFATLFVGRYDAHSQTLAYVNCGQEAGLVRRAATGAVETLTPTGPVLGGFGEAEFQEETVALATGDALALYTDGLSESGPTRTELLNGDGVAELLQRQPAVADARQIVAQLIAGVDSYAQGGVRDDQCLLVGIVTPTGL